MSHSLRTGAIGSDVSAAARAFPQSDVAQGRCSVSGGRPPLAFHAAEFESHPIGGQIVSGLARLSAALKRGRN